MNHLFRILLIILSIATGAVFLYSAYTKFSPIQGFEYTMVEFIHFPILLAKFAARFFIGSEAALGSLLILHFYGKTKWPIKVSIGLVIIFSIYLVWLWIAVGNNVNCGCFGDAIQMTPSVSLIKNFFLVLALLTLLKYHNGLTFFWTNVVSVTHIICCITILYFISPIVIRYKLDLSALQPNDGDKPASELLQGKRVIAFLNPQCMHCRKAGNKIHELLQKNPSLPFYLIIGSASGDLTDFWKDSHAEQVPHSRMAFDKFDSITGGIYPQIYWVNNGWVEENVSYPDLDAKAIERWEKNTSR